MVAAPYKKHQNDVNKCVHVTDKDDNSANNVISRSMTIMASQVGH
jgi:hypothetical protein